MKNQNKIDNATPKECGKTTPFGMYTCQLPKGHTGQHSWDAQPDKATTRPIRQLGTFKAEAGFRTRVVCEKESFNLFGLTVEDSEKQANRIDQLLTEHAALEAVAEAAERVCSGVQEGLNNDMPYMTDLGSKLQNALTNLAAIRGQKAGGK